MRIKKPFLKIGFLFFVICFLAASNIFSHQKYYPKPDTLIQNKWEQSRDLKFGLLVHWGAYSQRSIVENWSISPEDAD